MATIPPKSPTTSIRPGSRDTGFPEGFCGHRNTRLPHPEADLSSNAVITADDISMTRMLQRQRRSFLSKHKRTTSYGVVSPNAIASTSSTNMLSDVGGMVDSPAVENGEDHPSVSNFSRVLGPLPTNAVAGVPTGSSRRRVYGSKDSGISDEGDDVVGGGGSPSLDEANRPSTSYTGDDGEAREPVQLRMSTDESPSQSHRRGFLKKMRIGRN